VCAVDGTFGLLVSNHGAERVCGRIMQKVKIVCVNEHYWKPLEGFMVLDKLLLMTVTI
jgi:hypothetical protein